MDKAQDHRTRTLDEILACIPSLRMYALTLTRDPADAEVLVRQTLQNAINGTGTLGNGPSLCASLFAILRKAHHAINRVPLREAPPRDGCILTQSGAGPDQDSLPAGRRIMAGFASLPEDCREALVLVLVLGQSYEHAAAICVCSVETVKSRVSSAWQMVRDQPKSDPPDAAVHGR